VFWFQLLCWPVKCDKVSTCNSVHKFFKMKCHFKQHKNSSMFVISPLPLFLNRDSSWYQPHLCVCMCVHACIETFEDFLNPEN
jgi:hypothetical protein